MSVIESFSSEKVASLIREVEWIISELEDLTPNKLTEEDQQRHETALNHAYGLQDQLYLERARRSLVALQIELPPHKEIALSGGSEDD